METDAPNPMPGRLFPLLGESERKAMETLMRAIDEARPLPAKRRRSLPYAVRDLWASLTSERESRKGAYLSSPETLSAYLRFYLPWNVYRYVRLFQALDLSFLGPGSVLADLGSGPLSVPIALFIAKPALRSLPLAVYAVDRAPAALDAGFDILSSLSLLLENRLPSWRILRVHGDSGAPIKEKADLVSAGYFLNEFESRDPSMAERAARMARVAESRLKPEGRVLVLEAGDTRSASLVSALRAALIESGFEPIAPCPHAEPCPMPGFYRAKRNSGGTDPSEGEGRELLRDAHGKPLILASGKRPWCHFTFDSSGAPDRLVELSKQAGLPKESASLSFLFARRGKGGEAVGTPSGTEPEPVRVVSEPFPLPEDRTGRYACCHTGYALVRWDSAFPEWRHTLPGDLLSLDLGARRERDKKSGALVLDVPPPRGKKSSREEEPVRGDNPARAGNPLLARRSPGAGMPARGGKNPSGKRTATGSRRTRNDKPPRPGKPGKSRHT